MDNRRKVFYMLDMKWIRLNPDAAKAALKRRGLDGGSLIQPILQLDEMRRTLRIQSDDLKTTLNQKSKQIAALKKQGEDVTVAVEELRHLGNEVKELDKKIAEVEEEQQQKLWMLPNVPDESVVDRLKDGHVAVERTWGNPKDFPYPPRPHWELGAELGILDSETATKVTGQRFHFYKGLGARLERALINFFLDTHAESGYVEIFPPFLVNNESLLGTGQLPKFQDEMYKVENTELYLIPTAEVPLTNMYRDKVLREEDLPLKYCAYSACFRAEKSSAGKDTRGLIRQHQFNKVELVAFAKPESSAQMLEDITAQAEAVLKLLDLPYRVVSLPTDDLGFASAKTYDIEVWMPSYGRYIEISSCSNMKDFQARRASIKYKEYQTKKAQFVHTLNGSGIAVGRTVAAILENNQNGDGSVTIPEKLVPYMGGISTIKRNRTSF